MGSDGTIPAPDGSGRQVKVITVDDVVAYLKAHPIFFENHAELAEAMSLVPRAQGPGVIDMQQAILKRLRSEIDRLKNERTEIIANSKQNQIVQNRIQAAVISFWTSISSRSPSRPTPTLPSACRCAASMCWRRAPSMPPSAPTSTPACAPASPARRLSSATSPAS